MTDESLYAPSLVEMATRRLREEILSARLVPGERLIEEQIRRRYSISRAPLREALRLLAQQGLVEHLPRRGARVTEWSDTDIIELFAIRSVLEQHAIISAFPLSSTIREQRLDLLRDRLNRCASPAWPRINSARTMPTGRSMRPSWRWPATANSIWRSNPS